MSAPGFVSDTALRETQAVRVAEAAASFAETRTLTCAQIGALQTVTRSAANPQLRGIAEHILALWADAREPALAAMVAAASCDAEADIRAQIPARNLRPASSAEIASILSLPPRSPDANVLYFDPFRDRAAARRVAAAAREKAARREAWDPLAPEALAKPEASRPCDTEEPLP